MRLPSCLSYFCLCLPAVACAAEQAPRPLAVADILSERSFGIRIPLDLSPDGRWIAYTLTTAGRREATGDPRYFYFTRTGAPVEALGCDIWITNTQTGESKDLTGGKGTSWGPVWSPDGKSLAFCSDRDGLARLWLWDKEADKLRKVSDTVVRPMFGFEVVRWTPDGKGLLMKVLPEDLSVESAAALLADPPNPPVAKESQTTVRVYRSPEEKKEPRPDRPTWSNRYLSDLALIDVATGQAHRLARRVKMVGFWVSPDGSHAAYTVLQDDIRENTQEVLFDIRVVPLAGGTPRVLAARQPLTYGVSVSWSPDSKRLAYLTGDLHEKGDCFVVSRDGGPATLLTTGSEHHFAADNRAPLWDAGGQFLYMLGGNDVCKIHVADAKLTRLTRDWKRKPLDLVTSGPGRPWSPDAGRSLIVATRDEDTKHISFWRIDVDSGNATCLWEADQAFAAGANFSFRGTADGTRLLYAVEDVAHPPDLWVVGADFKDPRRLTRINPQLEGYTFGPSRLVQWRGRDGQTLRGAVLLPPDYRDGQRYPLIVKVYGGEAMSNSARRFGMSPHPVDNLHILATRGYAVFQPDSSLRVGSPVRDLFDTLMPGVDKVIEMGIADPDRMAIMGHSYGGYSTLALLTQTDRFRAAMMSAGFGNLLSLYGRMDASGHSFGTGYLEDGQGRMGGPPWQYFQRYLDNSPTFHLDRVKTPLLIVHGALDPTVPPEQAEEVFVGLRRLGREVVYARYEGEEHWQGTWGRANVLDYWTRVLGWFDTHLAPRPPAAAPRTSETPCKETVVRLRVSPTPAPKPALKYQLLPDVSELNPGNPAHGYIRCFMEQQNFFFSKEGTAERSKYLAMPLADIRASKLRDYGGGALRQADWAARLDSPDWQVLRRVQNDGINLQLEELQPLRLLAAALKVRFRVMVADRRFDEALRTAQTMFALARHLGEYPTEVGNLLGIDVAHQALDALEEMVQQPGCPNLYWALTDLPSPLVDLRKGVHGDRALAATNLRLLKDDAPMTPAQLDEALTQLATAMDFERFKGGRTIDSVRTRLKTLLKNEDAVVAARRRLVEAGYGVYLVLRFPAAQALLLDAKRDYEVRRDEGMKLLELPCWQIDALGAAYVPDSPRAALLLDLLPHIVRVRRTQARLEQRIGLLRHVEALRLYAAAHEGRLPEKLAEVAVPLPPDPFTGQPFLYRWEAGTAHLQGLPPRGEEKNPLFNIRYAVAIEQKKAS
jgi:dipeptidyl aminopeptidase/acylaminoacyl peptidase